MLLPSQDLIRSPVAAPVLRDHPVAALPEKDHLRVQCVGARRPAMRKDGRRPRPVILTEDPGAIFGRYCAYDSSSPGRCSGPRPTWCQQAARQDGALKAAVSFRRQIYQTGDVWDGCERETLAGRRDASLSNRTALWPSCSKKRGNEDAGNRGVPGPGGPMM
jgi:hypothetical protein